MYCVFMANKTPGVTKNKYQTRNSQNSQNVALLSFFFLSLAALAQYSSYFGSCMKQQYFTGSSALAHFFHNFKLFL